MFAPVGVLVLILLNFTCFSCKKVPCPLSLSVDISDGAKSGSNIVKQDLTYTPELYYEYEGTIRGCVCEIKHCVWKCCPEGQLHTEEECVNDTSAFTFNVHDKTELVKVENDYFYFMYPLVCNDSFTLDPNSEVEQMYLQKSGELYLPNDENSTYRFDEFCIDRFKYDGVVVFSARVCYTEKEIEKESREHLKLDAPGVNKPKVENNSEEESCVCDSKICIRKCCPKGQVKYQKKCTDYKSDFKLDVYSVYDSVEFARSDYHVIYDEYCEFGYYRLLPDLFDDDVFYFQNDGTLFLSNLNETYSPDLYCLEDFLDENEEGELNLTLSALVCFLVPPLEPETAYSFGMIISMPFLLITFIVYALIPERNLPAKALMCYVLSLLFAYIFLVTIQLHSSFEPFACATVGLLCYFFFMVSFFWMNSSCIDIWLTFSGIRGLTGSKKRDTRRFLYYSAYAWGVPFLLVCLVIGLAYGPSVDVKSLYHPGIGNGQCWFGSGMPTFLYFYLPIAILLTTNIVLFCVTAYKIQMVRNDTAMLRRDDSQRSRLESDKQRFNLYLKLLLAMGINWTMEVISWALNWKFSNIPDEVWYLTDFCNALYGVFIFFIFVFKRNIWIMLKKRYLTFVGKPHLAHSLGTSTTRTTVSHVTSEA